ncbi:MAG: diacylglycerol kinase family lipid kinase [Myxococcales bacterium]|nr:diacylglycerol kinase family lipid kinase [Myxococcales bacterium]
MAAEPIAVIVNPHSQGGGLGKKWFALSAQLRRHVAFDAHLTQRPGHATELARQALAAGAQTIVAVGGDGTINEVANGFFKDGAPQHPAASLAILPLGTGGDFRRSLGLGTEFDAACRVLAAGKTRALDVGLLRYALAGGGTASRIFVNVASFGVSGLVVSMVNNSGKKLGGRLTFMLASLRASMQYENQRVRLRFDEDETTAVDVTLNVCAIANGRYFGGGMMIAPAAELDDGRFDVVTLGDLSFGETLGLTTKIYAGTHLQHKKAASRRARVVEAEPVSPGQVLALDIDGEGDGQLPARFAVVAQALKVVVP